MKNKNKFLPRTLVSDIEFEGNGIHTNKRCKVRVVPFSECENMRSSENLVVNFISDGIKIDADVKNVVDTRNCTVLGSNKIRISTVEHFMSAVYGLGISGLNVYVYGQELPGFDGSAKEFVRGFKKVGFRNSVIEGRIWRIKRELNFELKNSKYRVVPAKNFQVYCEVDYDIIGKQRFELEVTSESYSKEISLAKTFCYYRDVEKLREMGLGKGGTLENVVVIGDKGIINKEVLSYGESEIVRHKILDFIGDFALLGIRVNGRVEVFNPSHYTNIEFVKYLKQFLLEE